jgi:AraC-like DNA-binding protein
MAITQYDFFKTKYGTELLIDLIRLQDLGRYIETSPCQQLSYYDITLITEASGSLTIDGHLRELKTGCLFFSSPGQVRQWKVGTSPKGYVLIFEDEFLLTFLADNQFIQQLSYFHPMTIAPILQLDQDDTKRVIALFDDIGSEISSFKNNDTRILRALLYQVLVYLHRKFVSVHPEFEIKPFNRYVKGFVELVDSHFRIHRNVDYYAQQLCVTSGHLNSLVKDYFGIGAKKYILNKNILEAKRLLLHTDMNVEEVASSLCYDNCNYFIKTFVQYSGKTPLQFRKEHNP